TYFSCHQRTLEKVKTLANVVHYGILACSNCSMLWDRNVSASKNFYEISMCVWSDGSRPAVSCRPDHEKDELNTTATNVGSQ
ncbi:hypothetical protein DFQ30_006580, partial [Apophysomyces sp. BC1015]